MLAVPQDLILARHGNAEQVAEGGDLARPLSEVGRAQARHVCRKLEGLGVRDITRVMTSHALRAMETASILDVARSAQPLVVPELYTAPEARLEEMCRLLFDELGHVPLAHYLNHHHSDVFHRYGRTVAQRILALLARAVREGGIPLIVGHGVNLPAVIYYLYPRSPEVREFALEHVFRECEAVRITQRTEHTFDFELIAP